MKDDNIEEGFWVFVSHSTKDFERVRLVRNALEDSGFRPILFYLKCLENENEVNDLLKREIDARKRFILCDSPNAQASKFVQSEVDYIKKQQRMYEIVDLSSIDLNSDSLQDDILQLIKPFRVRTNVYLSYNYYNDKELVQLISGNLSLQGFKSTDIAFLDSQEWYSYFGGVHASFQTVRQVIEATLLNGYLLYLIGESVSYFCQEELDLAYEIAPNMILPVIINQSFKGIPQVLQNINMINVSEIPSNEEKARAIVDALIALDLRNQNNAL